MGDSKSTSKLVSFGKTRSTGFIPEGYGDSKSPSEKDATEESLSSEPIRRSRKRTFRIEKKITSNDEASESTSEKKKKRVKGDVATSEESSEPPNTQQHKKPEKETDIKDKIKSFASKGAAAKSVVIEQAPQTSVEEERRRVESSLIQSRIQPTQDEKDEHLQPQTSRILFETPQAKQYHKRKSKIMQEQMLQGEQEEQTLANFIFDLVKRQREEKKESEHVMLSEAEIFEKSRNMSPLEEAGIVCVLEEAVAKLNILGFTHGKPVLKQEIKYVSILDKLADKESSDFVDLVKSNKSPEEHEKEKHFIKLQKDRGFLEESLNLTLLEMNEHRTFKILQDIVHLEEEMVKEEADLRFIGKNRQQEVNHCKALMERDHKKAKKKLDDRAALLALLKDEIQDMMYYNGLKFKYMDHWESSRAEQNTMMLQNKEKELDKQLLDFEQLTNIEMRCSAEMKALIETDITNMSDKVEEWMSKYEAEMEDRENKLTKLKEEREEHMKQLKEKTKLFNERQRQIDEWKAYKERLRLEAEHKALLIKMATYIQAWWRGTMVRRYLGPFKKLKPKHGKRHRKKKKK